MNARLVLRTFGAALLALVVALVILYGVLLYMQYGSASWGDSPSMPTTEERLEILAGLKAENTPTVNNREALLEGLSGEDTSRPDESERLRILESLRASP